jgi:hypothetical protein
MSFHINLLEAVAIAVHRLLIKLLVSRGSRALVGIYLLLVCG